MRVVVLQLRAALRQVVGLTLRLRQTGRKNAVGCQRPHLYQGAALPFHTFYTSHHPISPAAAHGRPAAREAVLPGYPAQPASQLRP